MKSCQIFEEIFLKKMKTEIFLLIAEWFGNVKKMKGLTKLQALQNCSNF